MIQLIEADQVVSLCSETLGLGKAHSIHDEVLLAALVRRAAGLVCPCSPGTLRRAVLESLFLLSEDVERLSDDVEMAVDKATIAGDLLELNQVTTDDPDVKGSWVFAAPPAFVRRSSGGVFLAGISPEGPSALPPDLAKRVQFDRHYRTLAPQAGEDLPKALKEFGLVELSERNWLKLPRQEEARTFVDRMTRELNELGPSGSVSDLQVLDGSRDPKFYKGRWSPAKNKSGIFVARRPQEYGAALWGLARLRDGELEKFLDLPPKRDKFRGADFAWHFQMALDHLSGKPQKFRVVGSGDPMRFDFFSPIPIWAERRLAIIGRTVERNRCLFSYEIPAREAEAEINFLKNYLWLGPETPDGSN